MIDQDIKQRVKIAGIFLLPILVIFGLTVFQPIATNVTTLVSSFYDNSWFWGIIGLFFPSFGTSHAKIAMDTRLTSSSRTLC